MRKSAIAAAVAVLALAGAAVLPRFFEQVRPATAAEAPSPPPVAPGVPVTAGKVELADVPVLLQAIGTVQAYNMVTIKSRVDGQLTKVAFNEGDEVTAGTPLFMIDPRPYEAQLAIAQAIKGKDEAQLQIAQADLERYGQLVGPGYQTRQSFEQQKATVLQLQAALKGDEASIDAARLNVTYASIVSPIDGRLGSRLVDIGNLVHAADTGGLVTITQMRPIFVSFTLPQNVLHKVREKQTAAPLEVIALGDDSKTVLAKGQLTLIDNSVDQTTGTIHLKASFANTDERLWPGAFVNVRVVLSTRKGVPTVPAQTVQEGPNGKIAYVIKSDDTVERRDVEIAAVQDGIAVVTKGLSAGERVVVDGQYRLTNGARVKVETSPGAAG